VEGNRKPMTPPIEAGPDPLSQALGLMELKRADPARASSPAPGVRPDGVGPARAVRRKRPSQLVSILLVVDALSLAESFAIGAALRQPFGSREGPPTLQSILHEAPFIPVYIFAMAVYGLYFRDQRRLRSASFLDIGRRGHALALGAILTLLASSVAYRLTDWPKIGWVQVLFMSLPAAAILPLTRGATELVLRRGGTNTSRVVIVGSGSVATSLAQRLKRCADIELLGFVDDNPYPSQAGPLGTPLGTLFDLPQLCDERGVDRVLVAFSQSSPTLVVEMLRKLPPAVRISIVPRLYELVTWQSQVDELHGLTVIDVSPACLGPLSRATKRSLDIAVSALPIILLSPFMALIAVAIKMTSAGPVFFRQDRVGYKGGIFRIIKFRTMEVGADEVKIDLREHNDVDGPLFKLHNDPRVTAVGRFLRSTSLDELPQLFNVLSGKMSLVGPRPFVPDESAGIDGWAARRFEVKPGMTGLWQISGRNDLSFDELRQLDYAYVASWSLWWDLKILWNTPGSVLRRHGAY
jgi:exopolysaccharide biosynthesis polyprenyl glycosylphosphotransferase